MSEKQVLRWKKQRSQGKWRWVLKEGLRFGIITFVFNYIVAWFFSNTSEFSVYWFPFLLLGGAFVGLIGWWENEGKYQNYLLDKKIERGLRL